MSLGEKKNLFNFTTFKEIIIKAIIYNEFFVIFFLFYLEITIDFIGVGRSEWREQRRIYGAEEIYLEKRIQLVRSPNNGKFSNFFFFVRNII